MMTLRSQAPMTEPYSGESPVVSVVMLTTVIALIAFGVVMVYSASAVWASRTYDNAQYCLLRQAIYAALGIGIILLISRINYRHYQSLSYLVLGVAVLLMTYTAFGFGHRSGGAVRWLNIGWFHIQPAEIAKLSVIMWLADSLSRKRERIRSFSIGFLPHVLIAGVMMLLCLRQPDFGSAVMIALLTFVMLFTAGARLGYILGGCIVGAPIAWGLIVSSEYRLRRIQSFLDPFEHRYDEGYQVAESLISFGSGGVLGRGLGDGHQKLFFLPEAHTDFISAIIGEEFGFVGVCLLLAAFACLAACGFIIAQRARDDHGTYLATGITLFLSMQVLINLAVAMGMVPTKGLVLPFISYGGSSLLVNCTAVAMLLSIARSAPLQVDNKSMRDNAPAARARWLAWIPYASARQRGRTA